MFKIKKLKKYAKKNNIPISRKKTIKTINKVINEKNYKSILEIGSAIGYFAIFIASKNENIKVTTIEKNKDLYQIAKNNVSYYNLDDKINLIYGDALLLDIKDKFDLIYIDGAKSKYKNFFNKYKDYLNKNGVIVCDNLKLKKLEKKKHIKNCRILLDKMDKFRNYLINNKKFSTKIVKKDDWFSFSFKK